MQHDIHLRGGKIYGDDGAIKDLSKSVSTRFETDKSCQNIYWNNITNSDNETGHSFLWCW